MCWILSFTLKKRSTHFQIHADTISVVTKYRWLIINKTYQYSNTRIHTQGQCIFSALSCNVLYRAVQCCAVLYCTVLHFTALDCTPIFLCTPKFFQWFTCHVMLLVCIQFNYFVLRNNGKLCEINSYFCFLLL